LIFQDDATLAIIPAKPIIAHSGHNKLDHVGKTKHAMKENLLARSLARLHREFLFITRKETLPEGAHEEQMCKAWKKKEDTGITLMVPRLDAIICRTS